MPPTDPPTVLHTSINGTVHSYETNRYSNGSHLWWSMQEEMRGVVRPESHGVSVHDMAAFMRDAVPVRSSPVRPATVPGVAKAT